MRFLVWAVVGACGFTGTTKDSADSGTPGPTSEEIQQIWNEYLTKHQGCSISEDCTVISPGCPLGCYAYVNVKYTQEASDLASSLIADYEEACGCGCTYSCKSEGEPTCIDGTCQAAPPKP